MRRAVAIAAALLLPLPALAHPGHGGPEEIIAAVLLIGVAGLAGYVVPKLLRRRRDD